MQLLERGPVLLDLSRLLAEADRGRGSLAFVAGEAGVGKTSLIRRFGDMIRDRGPVLVGACDPLSTPRPLGPLHEIADRLPGRGIDMSAGKDRIFRDLLDALSSAKHTPVLVFEDVHWADEATLDLLRFLARRIDERRALLIATFRDDEVGDRHPLRQALGDVATARGVRRLSLSPLSAASVRAMATGTGIDPDALYRQTRGNPFFVTEILASGSASVPPTVRDAVLARASRLPEPARRALEAAAVIGFRSEPWLLTQVAAGDAAGMESCRDAGMLIVEDGSYAFRHELARVAVLDAIAPHRRGELNRHALQLLCDAGPADADPARLAHHAEEAGDAAAVAVYAPLAARRAARLSAHREATAQYARALRFGDRLPVEVRAQILDEYATECAATDQYDDAIRVAREAAAEWHKLADGVREGASLGFLGGCLVSHGRLAEADATSRVGIALLEQFSPGPELAEAYARYSRVCTHRGDYDDARRWAERSLKLAERGGYARTRVIAYNRLGSAALSSGDDEGERILTRTLDLAREGGFHHEAVGLYVNLAAGWRYRFDFARAESYLLEGIALAEEHQFEGFLVPALSWRAEICMHTGRWAEAEDLARGLLRRATMSVIGRIIALTALGRVLVRRGDAEQRRVLDEALTYAAPSGMLKYLSPVHAMRAEAAWLAGDLERVRTEALSALDLPLAKRHPWFAGELLLWLARSGATVDVPDWIARPFALQIAGDARTAAAEWRRLGCPYEAAEALASSTDMEDVKVALAELERLGATPAAKRVRQRLQRNGIRGIPRGPHRSTRSNPAGLTAREIEIAGLLGQGFANADIAERLCVSVKTVDHHVSSILAKLGIHSRGQVSRAVARLGVPKIGESESEK